ncbi:MAG: hypothetical protein OEM50_02785 [Gammaproteobacteria bacterium]|nr:hypothetical protein [Gammaproteobacteria bacterium]MDH3362971.1 hypothetical protein [Gammaproteobacteria bacterium]MDH3480614.1 hypothetical protein [Gammaproteobacteria bacterium]
MKIRNVENRLAYVGALIVLIGVTWAAGSAFGAEPKRFEAAAVADREALDHAVVGAREAMTEAAANAAEALRAENKFDLDNHLNVLTSTLMARVK